MINTSWGKNFFFFKFTLLEFFPLEKYKLCIILSPAYFCSMVILEMLPFVNFLHISFFFVFF